MKIKKSFLAISLLALIYAVLLICVFTLGIDTVKHLPLLLLVSCFLVVFFHPQLDTRFAVYAAIVFMSGFVLQAIGVNTGTLFGQFLYGKHLGAALFETPLIMGILWLLLSYCSSVFMSQIVSGSAVLNTLFAKMFLAGLLMVSINVLMEQSAAVCDWWYWKYQVTPVQNYTAWFVFSVAFNFLFHKLEISAGNKVASWFLGIIWLFFFALAVLPAFWMNALQ